MADCIKIGNLDISAVKIGSTDPIIYVGGVKVYPTTPSTPKFYATYSDGTDYTVQCNSSSTLTTSDTKSHSTSYTAMTSGVIGDCVSIIGPQAFYAFRNLTSISMSNSVTSIGNYAFYYCDKLSSIDIPSGVSSIGGSVFANCNALTSIHIPNSVTSIGSYAFDSCLGLSSFTIPNTVTSIGEGLFYGCSNLASVTLPYNLITLPNETFMLCNSLASINIPSGVTTIGNNVFNGCNSLTSVDIPSGVTSIGGGAFSYCTSLTSITVNAVTPPALGYQPFNNTNNCPIYVPCDSVDVYKAASGWSAYASRIQAIPNSCPQTLQWVEFNNGDTIDTNLDIYGVSGNSMDLSDSISDNQEPICFSLERATVYCYIGSPNTCYTNSYSTSDTVELTFSNIGCSDYYNLYNSTTAVSTIKLLIYQ